MPSAKLYHLFLLEKNKDSSTGKLRLRLRWDKNVLTFNLGYNVDISKWSTDTQRCKNNTTHGDKKIMASVINKEINRYEEAAEEIWNDFAVKGVVPEKDIFKSVFLEKVRGVAVDTTKNTDFWCIYEDFTREIGTQNSWTNATYQKFNTLKSHLTRFKENLTFSDFDEKGLVNFVVYLRDEVEMRNTTIAKQLSFLKWFLRWATAKQYNTCRDFELFAPKLKTTENKVIFLEWEELMKIYNFEFPPTKAYLDRVRDVFCFCCFTSLRYSDVANLKWHNVADDYITITTVKTADTLTIELNDYSKAIIDKHRCKNYPNGMVLPVISNQKMNEYIKEMGYVCGIDTPVNITYYKGNQRIDEVHPKYELLGTHSGRRTFICNALMLGITPEVVMKWTGHSDYKSMKPYIDIADSAKREAMKLFNKK